jgi:hypothetical protein
MLNFAEAYFQAASHLQTALEEGHLRLRFHMPVYYLYCHTMELTLKAFLLARGLSVDEIRSRRLGHNLQGLWKECNAQGLKVQSAKAAALGQTIKLLNPFALRFDFRYLRVGMISLPPLEAVRGDAEHLIKLVRPHCN